MITYQQLGFVKDSDADKVDYDELLIELKEESRLGNEERIKAGLQTMELIGWAQKPFYDKGNKVLHWAKEYKTSENKDHTLNYDIRILGRKGVLSINAVAGMSNMPEVRSNINEVLKMASFTNGNSYADFDSNVDEVAAWTIGGLVAGKVLAKVGAFALIIKFWKFIAIGFAVTGGLIIKFFKKKKQDQMVYSPSNDQEPPQV